MFEKLDESSQKVVVEAQDLARFHGHIEVRTDHLLLAVVRRDSTVRALLEQRGVDVDALAAELMRRSPTPRGDVSDPHLPFGADYRRALEEAAETATDTAGRPVTPMELAVAVLRMPVTASVVLGEYGIDHHHLTSTA